MEIQISKSDIVWSYVAKFFSLATSLIVMPFVLSMLTAEEVGMNYLMASISSIVMLIDFGFGPQFGRNFSYVYSGAQTIQKEGVDRNEKGEINYHLLAILLKTAKLVYKRLSVAGLLSMLTCGTIYIYIITDGFTTIRYSLLIWIIYSLSVYFNFYYSYYTTLLTGSGMVAESNKATMLSRIAQIILTISMLYFGYGLMGVVIANLIAPFVQRYYCYKVYFTKELKSRINEIVVSKEISDAFQTIWYNAKKMGINMIGSYAINRIGIFLIGLYLPLAVVGSYGLLIQFGMILSGVAAIMNNSYMPKFSNYRIIDNIKELIRLFSFTVIVFWIIMLIGSLVIVFGAESVLNFIHSNTHLPQMWLCALYLLIITLESNHAMFAGFITTNNEVPFVKSGLISGGLIALLTYVGLEFYKFTLVGVVLTQGLVQLSYNNWYWPRYVLRDLDISLSEFINSGFGHMNGIIIHQVRRKWR